MTEAALTQFLIDVTRGYRSREFTDDPDAVIASSGLPKGLQTALREQDMASLWTSGAHPMALLYFARKSGWDNERYYSCIESTTRAR